MKSVWEAAKGEVADMRTNTRRDEDRGREASERRFVYLGAGYFLDRKTGRLIAL